MDISGKIYMLKTLLVIGIYLFFAGAVFGEKPKAESFQLVNKINPDESRAKMLQKMEWGCDYIINCPNYLKLKYYLFTSGTNQQINELNTQFETFKRERLILMATIIGQNKASQIRGIRYLPYVGIAVFVLIVILLYNTCSIKKQKDIEVNQKNASLNQLLREKEWLINEINHRVKNNLQIVTGLLQKQSSFVNNAEAFDAIQNSEHRMQSIALIHQKLYQSEGLTLIDMGGYIEELIGYLTGCFNTAPRLKFQCEVGDIQLDVNQAVPFGLILNEAITNSIKYAFPNSRPGLIKIILRQTKEYEYLLLIADNGVGLPLDFNMDANNSMGITLIKGLCRQLNGTLEIENQDGLTLKIAFRTDEILTPGFS